MRPSAFRLRLTLRGDRPVHQTIDLDYVTLIGWGTGSLNKYPISLWGTLLG